MKETYDIRYRQPGQVFWRKLKNVKGDGVEGQFRFFLQDTDALTYVSCAAEVKFPPERSAIIAHKMSREVGQPIQRA